MTRASLPDFFIAFELPNAPRRPTELELDDLHAKTIEFWNEQLQQDVTGFRGLELKVQGVYFGDEIDKERNVEPEFNLLLELTGYALLKKSNAQSGDDIFRKMVSGDSLKYLSAYVRAIGGFNICASALKVVARRYTPCGQGGRIDLPTFSIAFALNQDEPEAHMIEDGTISDHLKNDWNEHTHKVMSDALQEKWPDWFDRMTLDTTVAEKGTKKPSVDFHLYFENESTVYFTAGPPTPEEVFEVVVKSVGSGPSYAMGLLDMKDTPLASLTQLTTNVVEETEDIELPPVEKEEKTREDGAQSGQQASGKDDDLVTMNVPIVLKLVVNVEPPAELPEKEELEKFKDLMIRYFYTHVKKGYPFLKFISMKETDAKLGVDVADKRYNMAAEYDTQLKFSRHDGIPSKEVLKTFMVEVDLSVMMSHIQKLDPLCFKKVKGISVGKKKDKNVYVTPDPEFQAAVDHPPLLMPPRGPWDAWSNTTSQRSSNDSSHSSNSSATVPTSSDGCDESLFTEESVTEVGEPNMADSDIKVADPKDVKGEEEQEPTPTSDEIEIARDTQASKDAANETNNPVHDEDKAQDSPESDSDGSLKENRTSPRNRSPSTKSPVRIPKGAVSIPTERVQSSDIYVAYKLDRYSGPPSKDQLEVIRKETQAYFSKILKKAFPRFAHLELEIGDTAFGSGDVTPRVSEDSYGNMNVYIEWITTAGFRTDDTPSSLVRKVKGSSKRESVTAGFPTPASLTGVILKDIDIRSYLLEHVRTPKAPDFGSVCACYVQQRVEVMQDK